MEFESASDLLAAVRAYCAGELSRCAADIDRSDTIPDAVFQDLAALRLFAFTGLRDDEPAWPPLERLDLMLHALALIAEACPAVAKAVMDQNLGQVGMVREHGNPLLQAKLEEIRRGAKQAAFLMTEPQSGSDPSRFTTGYEEVPGGVLISGTKDWITGAARRQYFVTLAKAAGTAGEFGLFFIDREQVPAERIRVFDRKQKLGLRGLGEYRVELDRVFVPESHVVIPPGRGALRKVMAHYNLKRCGQAAIAIGATLAALRAAYAYLQQRFPDAGGIPFQHTLFVFADLVSRWSAARTLPHSALRETLDGDASGVPASIAKYVCTELAVEATGQLAPLCGGNGLSDKLPLERLMRDMRMLTVAGGASEVLKATVARNLDRLLAPDPAGPCTGTTFAPDAGLDAPAHAHASRDRLRRDDAVPAVS